ncbi:hypothetical protein [Clostridium rectalis]|uniref:hypothetical protein n=1 Tax=Clostridium rectalis TaxID=2040295 RepID=UPI000F62C36B|nr:hypothetical protein [Clostridium rectalis]
MKELAKLCLDTYRGQVPNFSAKDSSEVIRKAFVDMVGTDKIDYKIFRRHQNEIFEVIEETIDQLIVEGWDQNMFFERFVERKDLDFGDKNEFYVEDRSLLTISRFSGNHWDIRRQKLNVGESFNVPTKFYGAKIYADFARFLSGRVDWVAFVNKVKKSYDDFINGEIYTSFMNASSYLPSAFREKGDFTESRMLEICDHVSSSCGNAPITIVGTRTALNKMTGTINSEWISEGMKEAKNLKGIISHWDGIECMPISQVHKANTFDFLLNDKKLLIIPNNIKPVKLVNEGQTIIKEVSDGITNMDMSMEYAFQKKFGVGVVFNAMYGSFEIA